MRLRLEPIPVDISRIVENDEVVDVDYVFEVDRVTEHWILSDALNSPLDAPLDADVNDLKLRAEAIAEKVSVMCSTGGWSTDACALCLRRSDVVIELDDLSNVPPTELDNAVRYHIAAVGNFDLDNFLAAHVALDTREWMEGITKSAARTWLEAWRRSELGLTVLTAMPDGLDALDGIDLDDSIDVAPDEETLRAVFAARVAAFQSTPNFLFDEIKRRVSWDFRKFAAAAVLVTVIGLSTAFGLDWWQYSLEREALSEEAEVLDDLARDRRMMEFIERDRAELDSRRELLVSLSKETFPWRSVLVHFGTLHVEGVWLNEIRSTSDKSIELKCEAVSFEAMSEYIKALEADREFFRHEPQIKSSQVTRGGATVEFTVRIPML